MMLLALSLVLCVADSTAVTVSTKYGTVRGQSVTLSKNKIIHSFLGIPFAKPPVGDLRWKLPEEVEKWSGTLNAKSSGSLCPQFVSSHSHLRYTHPELLGYHGDEDCLTLNIYTPEISSTDRRFPVLVFFHGGSFNAGGAWPYSGHFLAGHDVVVVVPQYRLGILGFATTSEGIITPNLGMHDQIQALKFVQKTIHTFGGDPSKVTIMGQSAGAISVSMHIVSPLSHGLFQKAICESGSALNSFSFAIPQQKPYLLLTGVADKLGCPKDDATKMVECLQTKDASTLVKTSPRTYPRMPLLGWTPVVENGRGFLPDTPRNLRMLGKFSTVPLFAGIMAQDGGTFIGRIAPEARFGGLNKTVYEKVLRRAVAALFPDVHSSYRKEALFQALRFHYSEWPKLSNKLENRNRILQLTTDALFGTRQDSESKLHSRFAQMYFYVFSYTSTNPGKLVPDWMGAAHSQDIPFTFGYPNLKKNPEVRTESGITDDRQWTEKDAEMSELFMKLITNFVKTGNPTPLHVKAPNSGDTIRWPQFTYQGLNYLSIASKSEIKSRYRQKSYALWTNYLSWISTH